MTTTHANPTLDKALRDHANAVTDDVYDGATGQYVGSHGSSFETSTLVDNPHVAVNFALWGRPTPAQIAAALNAIGRAHGR